MKKNNANILKIIARKDYSWNKKRNILAVFAMLLTTFMLTTILGVGMSYWETLSKRSVMMEGMKFHVQLTEPTSQQVDKARKSKLVKDAGLTVKCGITTSINSTTMEKVKLYWSDDVCWKEQCLPAFEEFEGTYPNKENEIILSVQALKELGISNPQIGTELSVTYSILGQDEKAGKGQMILSGFYKDYAGGDNAYVSRVFYEKTGVKQTDLTQGFLKITLKNDLYSEKDVRTLQNELGIASNQVLMGDTDAINDFYKLLAGLILILFMLLISGYLFIHNVYYISISKDIRQYGQLKAIGVTPNQIKKIIDMQALWNAFIGIPIGIILGSCVGQLVIPNIISIASPTLDTEKIVSFNPIIFIGATIFTIFTVFASSRKPIRIASEITPIEAAKFNGILSAKGKRNSLKGCTLGNMAWRNISRDRKQMVAIFCSFFIALTVFLVVNVIVSGNSAKKILNQQYGYDLVVINQTILDEKPSDELDSELVDKLRGIEGVKTIRKIKTEKISVKYDKNMFGEYYKKLYKSRYAPSSNYEEDIERFNNKPDTSRLVGIDEDTFDLINLELGGIIDKEEFLNGNVALIKGIFGISVRDSVRKNVSFEIENSNRKEIIKIVADCSTTEVNLNYFSNGYAPSIIVCEKYLNKSPIELLAIDYTKPFDKTIEAQIKKSINENAEVSFDSKLSDYSYMKNSEDNIRTLGNGLGIILAMLAYVNYCNLMVVNVQNRQFEFAILNSIGMTNKQIRKTLSFEGLYYGGISCVLVTVVGMPLSYLIFSVTNKYGIPFSFPIGMGLIIFTMVMVVCVLVPPIAFHFTRANNIVERIKTTE